MLGHWAPRIALIAIAVAIVWTFVVLVRFYGGEIGLLTAVSVAILVIVVKGR